MRASETAPVADAGNDRREASAAQPSSNCSNNNRRTRSPGREWCQVTDPGTQLDPTASGQGRRQRRRTDSRAPSASNTSPSNPATASASNCCSCYWKGSKCIRPRFGGNTQGCACVTDGRKCRPDCHCIHYNNKHTTPTPGQRPPAYSITNYFGRGGNGDRSSAPPAESSDEADEITLPAPGSTGAVSNGANRSTGPLPTTLGKVEMATDPLLHLKN